MDTMKTVDGTTENEGFMFYESYKTTIDKIRKLYGEDEAGMFCLELIRYGVRRERSIEMRPELEAIMKSICPLIEKSKEHKDQAVKAYWNCLKNEKKHDNQPPSVN